MTSHKDEDPKSKDIPDIVVDSATQKKYLKGRFLGKVYGQLTSLFLYYKVPSVLLLCSSIWRSMNSVPLHSIN